MTEEDRRHADAGQQEEEPLRATQPRFDALLDAIPDIVMEVDRHKVYTWANRAGLEFFGADVVGREANFYFEGEQETYAVVAPLFEGDDRVLYVESWQHRRDGQRRLLAWWSRSLKDAHGTVTGVISTARDITDHARAMEDLRRRSEELAAVLDVLPAIVWIGLDPECRVVTGNRAASEFAGTTPGTNVSRTGVATGQTVQFVLLEEDGREYREEELPMHRAIALGKPVRDLRIRFRFPDGREADTLGSAAPLFDAEGRVRGSVAAFSDVTESRGAEKRIRSQLDELRRWREVMLGREDRVQELKREVNELGHRMGEPARYPSQEEDAPGSDVVGPRS